MAKIKVMGDTVQICTSLTVDEINKVAFYKPEALTLVDEQTKEPYFGVGMGDASFGKHGIMFSSKDTDGTAFMTTPNPVTNDHSEPEKEAAIITAKFATLINNLKQVEAQVNLILEDVDDIEKETFSSIEFVGLNTVAEEA